MSAREIRLAGRLVGRTHRPAEKVASEGSQSFNHVVE